MSGIAWSVFSHVKYSSIQETHKGLILHHHVFQSYADLKTLTVFWILVWNNSFLHSSQLFSKAGHYPDWRKQTGQTGINSFPLKWPRPSLKVKPKVGFWKRASISLKNTCWHMTSAFVTHPSTTFQTELEPEAAFTHLFLWTVLLPRTKNPWLFLVLQPPSSLSFVCVFPFGGGGLLPPSLDVWTFNGEHLSKRKHCWVKSRRWKFLDSHPSRPWTHHWMSRGGCFQQKLAQDEGNWC